MSRAGPAPRASVNPLIKLVTVPVFAALALATNYAMLGLPNVKLMDALVFISAFLFGIETGISTAVLVWGVYGYVNPLGPDPFPLILFLMIGECFYAVAGVLMRRMFLTKSFLFGGWRFVKSITLFGLIGFVATFCYDLLTNFATYLPYASSPYQALIIGMITGAPFALLHEGSNLFFFGLVAPGVIAVSRDLLKFGVR